MANTEKLLSRIGLERDEVTKAYFAKKQSPSTLKGMLVDTLVPDLYKAYMSGVTKDEIVALLEHGYEFAYRKPNTKPGESPSNTYLNDTFMRLGVCKGDAEMVVLSTELDIPLKELTELVEKGTTAQDLRVLYNLS